MGGSLLHLPVPPSLFRGSHEACTCGSVESLFLLPHIVPFPPSLQYAMHCDWVPSSLVLSFSSLSLLFAIPVTGKDMLSCFQTKDAMMLHGKVSPLSGCFVCTVSLLHGLLSFNTINITVYLYIKADLLSHVEQFIVIAVVLVICYSPQ